MVKHVMIISVIVCVLNLSTVQEALTGSKISGTIHYRNAQEVTCTEIGSSTTVLIYKVVGKIKAKDVKYHFSELLEIHFIEDSKEYNSSKSKGSIRIVDRSRVPLILEDAYITIGYFSSPNISCRFLDPATNSYRWKESRIVNNISYITFNEN